MSPFQGVELGVSGTGRKWFCISKVSSVMLSSQVGEWGRERRARRTGVVSRTIPPPTVKGIRTESSRTGLPGRVEVW